MSEGGDLRTAIDQEHEAIETLLSDLEAASDPRTMLTTLEKLGVLLESHFEREEASNGLFAAIGKDAVQLVPHIDGLFLEHRTFTTTVRQLREQCRRLAQGQLEAHNAAQALVLQLRDHEQRENQLFVKAVYAEYGGGD